MSGASTLSLLLPPRRRIQVAYGFFSGFAGVSLFNSLCVSAYNVVLFVPIMLFVTDRDITQTTALAQPQAYRMCNEGTMLTWRTMLTWFGHGLCHGLVIALVGLYGSGASPVGDYESIGLVIYFGYTWVQDVVMLFLLRRVNWMNISTIFGTHLVMLAAMLAANTNFGLHGLIDYGALTRAVGDPSFWLQHLLVTSLCVVPMQVWRTWQHAFSTLFAFRLARWDAAQDRIARHAGCVPERVAPARPTTMHGMAAPKISPCEQERRHPPQPV